MDRSTLAVEWVTLDRLQGNPANPRLNDAAVPHVAASIRRFGWRQPIVARQSGEVIAGNTRLKAAAELGLSEVPIVWFDGTDLEATAYGIADNRTHEFAEWDEPALAKLLEELRVEDSLDGVGYTGEDIDALLAELGSDDEQGEVDDPGPEELPVVPASRRGDLWLLGGHRLVCDDSTNADVIARVMNGGLADLVWTDPPYGVSYVGKTADALEIENDDLGPEGLQEFLRGALGNALEASKPGAVWYVAAPAGPNFLPFAKCLADLGVWRQTLVWLKDAFVLGRSDYHYRHEAILYGWKPGAAHQEPPDRTRDTIWEVPRPRASPDHPTSKPVELIERALHMSTARGGLVLDPFIGSGSTLIAAEASGRRAAGVELDPRYCDVVIRRWQEATGAEAVLEGDGRTFAELRSEREAA